MTSLEGWGSTIELRPRADARSVSPPVSTVRVPATGPQAEPPPGQLRQHEKLPVEDRQWEGKACGAVGYGSV
jgi:hypothetical protein